MKVFSGKDNAQELRSKLLNTPFSAKVIRHPSTKPIGGYKRKWFTLWLLPVATPSYELLSKMKVLLKFKTGEEFIFVIPKGFVTDFASIPRLLWSMYPPDGKHRGGAIPHDMGYAIKAYKRLMDEMFKQLLRSEKVDDSVVNIFFSAVNWFGFSAYKNRSKRSIEKASKLFIDNNNLDTVYLFLGDER